MTFDHQNRRWIGIKSSLNGFTLIELVVVIVLLGILSAVALPKFRGFSREANLSTLRTTLSAVQTAANASLMQCASTPGCNINADPSIPIRAPDGINMGTLKYGYPRGNRSGGYLGITDWLNLN